jgi:hypothetical protein
MTILEAVQVIAGWRIGGGIYTDESAANNQLLMINMLNTASRAVLRQYYIQTRKIPQIAYQTFDVIPNWTNEECVSFTAIMPSGVMNFPPPKLNGWDALYLKCDTSSPLTEIESVQQLRGYARHKYGSIMQTNGEYFVDGVNIEGRLKAGVKSTDMEGRAVLSEPHLVPSFSWEKDQYPFPDDMMGDVKLFLEKENFRSWQKPSDQLSNSKVDTDGIATR